MLSTILVIAGILCVLIGAYLIIRPPKPEPPNRELTEGVPGDFAKLIEQVVKLLERFEKRFVPGVFLMLIGLTLIGFGAWFEAQEAKDAADEAADSAALLLASPFLLKRRAL
jgi:uncharacterized membrane protein